jgi:uncharacterized protein YndB with AHSA1/START domain
MRIAIYAVVAVIALLVVAILVMLAIGSRLPRAHVASRSVLIRRPPEVVYGAIASVAAAPQWRPELVGVELLPPENGRPHFRELTKHGSVTYEVVEQQPPHRFVTRIVDRNLGYSGGWTYTLTPEEGGTRLEIREDGEVSNLLFRFLSRFVFGHTATIDRYLAALSKHLQ